MDQVLNGDLDLFDNWAGQPKQARDVSEWGRIVINSLLLRGRRIKPKDDVWDPTLGYEGDGLARVPVPAEYADLDRYV